MRQDAARISTRRSKILQNKTEPSSLTRTETPHPTIGHSIFADDIKAQLTSDHNPLTPSIGSRLHLDGWCMG